MADIKNSTGNPLLIVGTEGADFIENTLNGATIRALGGKDSIQNTGSSVSIDGGGDGDIIYNDTENATVDAGAGNDSIGNHGGRHDGVDRRNSINAGDGDDTIDNHGGNSNTLIGGAGNDSIFNGNDDYTSISGGTGSDTISNLGAYVTIDGGAGDDYIFNDNDEENNHHASINGGAGDDTIVNHEGKNVLFTYDEGDGNDTIYGFNATSTLNISSGLDSTQKSGNDIIVTVGEGKITLKDAASLSSPKIVVELCTDEPDPEGNIIVGTEGADFIENTLDGATIRALGGKDSIQNTGSSVSIDGGGDGDIIYNNAENTTVDAGAGNDSIGNHGGRHDGVDRRNSINAGDGDDTIDNHGGNSNTLIGGAGNDSIFNGNDDYTSISGGTGSDTISNLGAYVTIDGGAGNDSISNDNDEANNHHASIAGGKGDDFIRNNGGENLLVTYTDGDGNDTVYGFRSDSTLQIGDGDGTYSTQVSGNDVIVTVGDGSITLKDVASLGASLNVEGEESEPVNPLLIIGTPDSDTINNSLAGATIQALGDNDSVRNTGASVSVDAGTGNDTVENTGYGAWDSDAHKYAVVGSPDDATIIGGSGNDSLVNYGGKRVLIQGGTNDDYIANDEKPCDPAAGGPYTDEGLDFDDPPNDNDKDKDIEIVMRSVSDNLDADGSDSAPDYATLDGGTGHDTIYNSGSNVSVSGGKGNDSLYNYTGDNVTLDAGDGADTLSNGQWHDYGGYNVSLAGGIGNDSLLNSGDDSTLDAGDGNDTVDNSGAKNVLIDAGAGDDSIINSSLESWGSDGVHYVHTPDNATIIAGKGDDTVTNRGSSVLFTYDEGDGNDTIYGFNATSTLQIGDGEGTYSKETVDNDIVITVGEGSITLVDAADLATPNIAGTDDTETTPSALGINNTLDNKLIIGTEFDDTIVNSGDKVTIDALAGNDSIVNSGDNVSVSGSDDDDIIANSGKYVTINTGNGDNYVELAEGSSRQTVLAQDGNDTIKISGQQAFIDSKGGDDYIVNGGTKVTINAGAGNDTVISSQGAGVTVDGGAGNDLIFGSGGNTMATIIDTENEDILEGGSGNDLLSGLAGRDKIDGNGGNDTLIGGKGNDTLTGGDGNDVFVYGTGNSTALNDFTYVDGDGNDVITDYAEGDRISVVGEGVVDSVYASGNDVIFKVGNGQITVKDAKDLVITYYDANGEKTFPQPDVAFSSDGKTATLLENYSGGSFDIADYADYNGKDYSSSVQTIDASAVQRDIAITGNKLKNNIIGSEGNDTLIGGAGNDTLTGGDGADVFVHNAGDGTDIIEDYQNEDVIKVDGTVSKITQTQTGNVILWIGSSKIISVKGGADHVVTYVDDTGSHTYPEVVKVEGTSVSLLSAYIDDTFDVNTNSYVADDNPAEIKTIDASLVEHDLAITGNKLANKILGGEGNDSIAGGAGNDNLTGNGGADVFVYSAGKDTITDYNAADGDVIQIDGTVTKIAESGDDIVFTVGSTKKTITVKDGLSQLITYVDDSGEPKTYPNVPQVVIDGKKITLTEYYAADTFDIADYGSKLQTIDASAVQHSVAITANSLANNITGSAEDDIIDGGAGKDKIDGGDGNDILIGGKGNDTLTGGDGDNVFVFETGEGNNVITDFKNTDTILITSGNASAVGWAASTDGDVVMTVGTTKVTLQDAAGKYIHVVDSDGGESWYPDPPPDPVIYKDKTAILTEGYLYDTFVRSDYSDISADIRNIDATAVTHDISIVGDANKNSIVGSSQNDFINGAAGNDTIDGGEGDDTLQGGKGTDKLTGGDGADVFVWNSGDGNDIITDFTAEDTLQIAGATIDTAKITTKGDDLIIPVGKNNITLTGAANTRVVIDNGGEEPIIINDVPLVEIEGKKITLTEYYPFDTFNVADYGSNLTSIDASAVQHSVAITANSLANNITGSAEDDIIDGGAGKDKIDGGDGNDTIIGGKANDTLTGGDGADVFFYTTGDGNDVITDYQNEDVVYVDGTVSKVTESGNNLVLTVGSQKITVQAASDKRVTYIDETGEYRIPNVPDGIIEGKKITLTEYYPSDTFDVADYGKNLQTIDASAVQHSVAITANTLANNITGSAEDDIIDGGAGKDKIDGGDGNDTIIGGKGNDTLTGGDGADVFVYNSGDGNDVITDFTAEDMIQIVGATLSSHTVSGKDMILTVGSNKITLKGAADTRVVIDDDSEEQKVINDVPPVVIDGKVIKLTEYYAADTFNVANYGSNLQTIDASAVQHSIAITANSLANSIVGTDDDDIIDAGKGKDKIFGGGGADVFIYNSGDGNDTIEDYAEEDIIRVDSGTAKFSKSGNNVIMTVGSNKVTITGAKDKVITWINADGEINYYPKLPVSVKGTAVTLLDVYSADTFDLATNPYIDDDDRDAIKTIDATAVEHNIAITGNKQPNKITGGAGNDTFTGGTGNDTIDGGDGADVFVYNTGDGNDVIQNYTEEDRLFFADTKIDTMNVSVSGNDVVFTVGGGKVTVKDAKDKVIAYSDIDGEEVVAHSYPEIIRFSADGETATLLEGYNKETFDIADYPAYAASVRTINASAVKQDIAIKGNANKNTIVGSSSNDNINGMAGQDVLYGGEGNDTLTGGTGNDTLYGGEGTDTFEYKKGDGNDVIADYQEGEAIRITDITGVYCENKGDDVVMRVGSNTITIRNANTDENAFTPITYYDGSGQHSYIPGLENSDLLIDDNYSATAALSSIVEPVKAQYTPYDFEGGFDLVKQPAFAPATAYSDKK